MILACRTSTQPDVETPVKKNKLVWELCLSVATTRSGYSAPKFQNVLYLLRFKIEFVSLLVKFHSLFSHMFVRKSVQLIDDLQLKKGDEPCLQDVDAA